MFSWPDVVATLGTIALAILGGYLKVLPEKLVAGLVMAAAGFFTARAALRARAQAKGELEASPSGHHEHQHGSTEDGGVVEEIPERQDSGVVQIAPQLSGRVVRVASNGSVYVGPEEGTDVASPDDSTPPEHRGPTTEEDSGGTHS